MRGLSDVLVIEFDTGLVYLLVLFHATMLHRPLVEIEGFDGCLRGLCCAVGSRATFWSVKMNGIKGGSECSIDEIRYVL